MRYRHKHRNEGGSSYLDCSSCPLTIHERREWNCRYVDESRWLKHPSFPRAHDPLGEMLDYEPCHGGLLDHPHVIETALAYPWWDKGQLRDRYQAEGYEPTPLLHSCIQVLAASVAAATGYTEPRP